MIEITLIITLVIGCLLLCGIAGAYAGYYRGLAAGAAEGYAKFAVEQKRQNKRLSFDLHLWQNKFVQRTGAGSLTGERYIRPPENQQPKRIIESPREANARTREKMENPLPPTPLAVPEKVPRKVADEFLKNAAAFAPDRS